MKDKKTVVTWQNSNGRYLTGSFLFYCSLFILMLASAELVKTVTYSIWGVEAEATIHQLVDTQSRACMDCNEVTYSYSADASGQVIEGQRTISDRQVSRLVENRTLQITYLSFFPSNSIFGHTWDDLGIMLFCIAIGLLGAGLGKFVLRGKAFSLDEMRLKLKAIG